MAPSLAICRDLADLLDYPGDRIAARAEACLASLEEADPAAAAFVRDFHKGLAERTGGQVEEAYTRAFDMQSDRCLYVGHHLFGEDPRRNLFLSMLTRHYQARGFSSGAELADYLPAMLRFAAEHSAEDETGDLIAECVIPALRKIAAGEGFYALPARAALRFLAGEEA